MVVLEAEVTVVVAKQAQAQLKADWVESAMSDIANKSSGHKGSLATSIPDWANTIGLRVSHLAADLVLAQ